MIGMIRGHLRHCSGSSTPQSKTQPASTTPATTWQTNLDVLSCNPEMYGMLYMKASLFPVIMARFVDEYIDT
jgi:hypothetical protein